MGLNEDVAYVIFMKCGDKTSLGSSFCSAKADFQQNCWRSFYNHA